MEILTSAVHSGDLDSAEALIRSFGLCNSGAWSNSYDLLRDAVKLEHPEMAKMLLQSGAKVDADGESDPGATPLHYAAIKGYTEIVSMLLERNANVQVLDEAAETPLHKAAEKGFLEIVKLLMVRTEIIHSEGSPESPVLRALHRNNIEIVKELINHGVRVNNTDIENWIGLGCTPLHLAVFQGDKTQVEAFLCNGIDVDTPMRYNKTSLHIATLMNNGRLVEFLLERGADVNAMEQWFSTALHHASHAGSTEVVKILLANGANADAEDECVHTPILYAAESNYPTVVKMLLDYGADVNFRRFDNMNALHRATENGHVDVVTLLLERNAHLHDRDDSGRTPLHLAAEFGIPSAVRLLLDHGADVNDTCRGSKTPLDYANSVIIDCIQFDDEIVTGYKVVAEILVQHTIEMIVRGLYVSDENFTAVDLYNKSRGVAVNLRTEIAQMKTEYIGDCNVTFIDVAAGNMHQLVNYARNGNIVQAIESEHFHSHFPTCSRILNGCLKKGQIRVNLMSSSNNSLSRLVGYVLPDIVVDKLAKYLSNEELEKLTNANLSDNDCDI